MGPPPLVGAVVVTVTSYIWMMFPTCPVFFWAWVVGFPLVVLGFMVYSTVAVLMI
jgi:hypothetical protein